MLAFYVNYQAAEHEAMEVERILKHSVVTEEEQGEKGKDFGGLRFLSHDALLLTTPSTLYLINFTLKTTD